MNSEDNMIEITTDIREDVIAEAIAQNSLNPVKFVLLLDENLEDWDFTFSVITSLINRILLDFQTEEKRIHDQILHESFELKGIKKSDANVLKRVKQLEGNIKRLQTVYKSIIKVAKEEEVLLDDPK